MVENGNAKRAKSGNGKCCCVVSTIVIVAALAVGAFIYRENIVEEIEKLSKSNVRLMTTMIHSCQRFTYVKQ